MDILIIGGTRFLGRHVAAAALARGHRLTLFHRGRTGADLFPDVPHILGDRDGGLDALGDGRWDAVVDTCGYVPRVVRASAERLAGVSRYAFVSSISVYKDVTADGPDEDHPVSEPPPDAVETVDGETYGPLKVGCERAVRTVFGERALIVRPGLLVGPHDPTDRFAYWPARTAEGGRMLAPPADGRLQVIDARDLADWLVRGLEDGLSGTFNATGPAEPHRFGDVVAACVAATGGVAEPVHAGDAALGAAGVRPWTDLPLWLPAGHDGIHRTDVSRAVAAGLRFRPLEETVRDVAAWLAARPEGAPATGLPRAREAEVLAAIVPRLAESRGT